MHLPKNCVQLNFLYVQAKLSMVGHLTNQSKMVTFGSDHPMFSVTPDCCSAECEIFVGLIMQYHYVGLDKLPVCGASVQQSGRVQLVCQSATKYQF